MTRCPACRQANPSAAAFCMHCGLALAPRPAELLWRRGDLWAPVAAREAALLAVVVVLLRSLLGPLLRVQAGIRQEGWVAVFHLSLALACGAGVAVLRRAREGKLGAAYWSAWALAGGLLSFGLDYAYTYQRLLYRVVWNTLEVLFPHPGTLSAQRTYGVLQILRFAGPALFLWLGHLVRVRRPGLRLQAQAWCLAALVLRYPLRGAGVSVYQPELGQVFLYISSVFFLFYGLAPRSSEPAHRP